MGWALEYVDGLDAGEAREVISIIQNYDKATADDRAKAALRRRPRRR